MANFQLLDVDDNIITFGDFEEVPPGQSYSTLTGGALTLKLQNISGVSKTNRRLSVVASAPNTINTYVTLSLDGVTFSPGPLELGAFAVGETKTFFFDATVPAGAPGGANQRCTLEILPSNS